jgi:hypothetical protein
MVKVTTFGQSDGEVLEEFSSYLASCWSGQFNHQYNISKSRVWKNWLKTSGNSEFWSCDNLQDAFEKYSWVSDTGTITPTNLKTSMQEALSKNDELAARTACFDIFKWGGVSLSEKRNVSGNYVDKSRNWVETMFSNGELCKQIKLAVRLLQPECDEGLSDFSSSGLLMNSSMTKVYAFADQEQNIAIYDSRVGAALGLIARIFLEDESNEYDQIPRQLRFMWGESKSKVGTRDPSNALYKFPKLPYGSKADRVKAELSRDTNILLQMALKKINQFAPAVDLEDIERSLFMIGYDVRQKSGGIM